MSGPKARLPIFLYEGPGARPLDRDRKLGLLSTLLGKGYSVSTAGCSCELSEAATPGAMTVLGLFEAPMPERLEQDGTAILFRDISGLDGDAILEAAAAAGTDPPGKWIPWFPVIDRSLCDSCGKCLGFCLFGVYEAEGRRVRVARPENCKTNCPACARICPRCAIIFPKHRGAPIDGSPVLPGHLPAAGDRMETILKGKIEEALRSRSSQPAGVPPSAGTGGAGRRSP